MRIFISPAGRVVCSARILLPISAGAAWGQLRDFNSSARHDPFHAEIEIEGGVPRAGAGLRIVHRYLFFKTVRIGRILWWKEGAGFAFSDLSERDLGSGFPHVLRYRVVVIGEQSSALEISVGGRWTGLGPRWVGRVWLWWVFSHVVRRVENQLLGYAVVLRRVGGDGAGVRQSRGSTGSPGA